MVAALAMMELMTSEQITNAGSVTADHDSIQTHAQTRSRQNSLATGGPSERKCDLRWRPAMLRPVSLRALLPWLTSIIGIASALCLVIAWFPSTVWNTPIASSDAPAHYYFIRRLLDEGLGAALHLWPHNSFYPPLFHICAYFVIKIAALFGVQCSIYAAFNITWIIASGVIFLPECWYCAGIFYNVGIAAIEFPIEFHVFPIQFHVFRKHRLLLNRRPYLNRRMFQTSMHRQL